MGLSYPIFRLPNYPQATGTRPAIDVYLPGTTDTPVPLTMHNGAFQTNYVSETGNHVGVATLPTVATVPNWFLIARVDVQASGAVSGLVTLVLPQIFI
jgi:hypothetical protein